MAQAMIRTKATHDPASFEGQAFVEHVLHFQVTVSGGSGAVAFWSAAPGVLVSEVIGRISTALDAGTVDIGDEDTADAFIANNEWTETTVNQIASSKQTTAPDGKYYAAQKNLVCTVGGAATSGVVEILVRYFQLVEMGVQGFHNSVSVP